MKRPVTYVIGLGLLLDFLHAVSTLQYDGYGVHVAAVGTKTSLPCNASKWGEDLVSLVLWYKENNGIGLPIYSVDARVTPLSKSKHSTTKIYKDRLFFDVKLTPPILTIDPVLETDVGDYRCRVDYRKSRTKNFVTKLEIIVPPKDVIILDAEGQRLRGIAGPYDEDSNLVLFCEAEEGIPLPNVTWWRKETLIDDTFEVAPHGNVRNKLVLSPILREFYAQELICKASNTNLTVPKESSIILDMNLRPYEVKIRTPMQALSAGKSVELECLSFGSRPPARVTWWKNNKLLLSTETALSKDGNVTLSRVSFVPVEKDNGKHISCRAENLQLELSTIEDRRLLNVHFVPRLSISVKGSAQDTLSVSEGADLFLECIVHANPQVTHLTWFFQGNPLVTDPKEDILLVNQSLILRGVQRQRKGRYSCRSTNSEGEGRSPEFHLKINHPPVCKPGLRLIYTAAKEQTVRISCEVDAEPEDVSFRWSLNESSSLLLDFQTFTSNGTKSVATYVFQSANKALLYCWAQNSLGFQKEPCTFTILEEESLVCFIGNQSQTSVSIECLPPQSGDSNLNFVVEVYDLPIKKLFLNLTSSGNVFHISNLPPGTSLTVVIHAINSLGQRTRFRLSGKTLSNREERTDFEYRLLISPILGVLIGVIVVLVIVSITVVIFLRLRADHYEEEQCKEPKELRSPKFEKVQSCSVEYTTTSSPELQKTPEKDTGTVDQYTHYITMY